MNQVACSTSDSKGEEPIQYSTYKITYFPDCNQPNKDTGLLFLINFAQFPIEAIYMFLSRSTDEVLTLCEDYMFNNKRFNAQALSHLKCAPQAAMFLKSILEEETDMEVPYGILAWFVSGGYLSGEELLHHLLTDKEYAEQLKVLGVELPKPRVHECSIESSLHRRKLMWDFVRKCSASSFFKYTLRYNGCLKEGNRVKSEKQIRDSRHSVKAENRRSTSYCHGGGNRHRHPNMAAVGPEKRHREEAYNPGTPAKILKAEKVNTSQADNQPKKVTFGNQRQNGNGAEPSSKSRPYHAGKHQSA